MNKYILIGSILSVILVIFFYRRSGFVPQPGAQISIMDLMEFSALPPNVSAAYLAGLNSNLSTYLPSVTNAPAMYMSILSQNLAAAMSNTVPMTPPVPPAGTSIPLSYCQNGYVNIVGICMPGSCPTGSINTQGTCIAAPNTTFTMNKTTNIITVTSVPCTGQTISNNITNQQLCIPS